MINRTNGPLFDANGHEIAPGAAIVQRDHGPEAPSIEAPAVEPGQAPLTIEQAREMAIAEIAGSTDVDALKLAVRYSQHLFVITAATNRLAELRVTLEPIATVTNVDGSDVEREPDGTIKGQPLNLTDAERANLPPLLPQDADVPFVLGHGPIATGGLVTEDAVAITKLDEAQAIAVVATVEDGDVLRELANLVAPDAVKEAAAARLAVLVEAAKAEAAKLADGNAPEAIAAVKATQDKDLLRIVADADIRKTVKEAATDRLADLEKVTRG